LTFFLIAKSLFPVGLSSRDDPDDLVILVLETDSMGYQQQQHTPGKSKRLPTALITFDAVVVELGPLDLQTPAEQRRSSRRAFFCLLSP